MKAFKIGLAVLSGTLILTSCDREPKPGKGGNAILKITPRHHSTPIDSCMVYIKYGATNLPDNFDDSARCVPENGKPVATFSNLNKGNYYLFARGWDPDIVEAVKGGIPYEIKEETTQEYNLSVTEDQH